MGAPAWADLVARTNRAARQPVLFLPALVGAPIAWGPWLEVFEAAGYGVLAPVWPEARSGAAAVESLFGRAETAFATLARALSNRPAVIGHGTGARVAQALAANGLSAATVLVEPHPPPEPPAAALPSSDIAARLLVTPGGDTALDRANAESALTFIQRFV